MNSDDLILFLRASKAGSLSRTSIQFGISQPALSRRFAALEQELGTRLFHRSGRGLELTETGQQLLKHAIEVERLIDTTLSDMAMTVRGGPARAVIAAQPTIARMLFGSIAKNLQENYPGIRISLREGLGGQVQGWLADGSIDMAILYLSEAQKNLEADIVLREHLSFVAPPAFDLPGGHFPVERLPEVPLVLPSRPHGLRVLAEDLCQRSGRLPRISMECDASVYITKQLVAENCGCTILPLAAIGTELSQGLLQAVPLGNPPIVRDIAIVTSSNRPPLAGRWNVVQAFRQEIARLAADRLWPGAFLPGTTADFASGFLPGMPPGPFSAESGGGS